MSKNLEVAILLDFYGSMLTDKQRDLIDLYYNEDLSLGEIAQLEKITRQGVRDSIKRGELFLYEMEDKLGMLKRYRELQVIFKDISALATDIYEISNKYNYSIDLKKDSEKILELTEKQIDF